jgi:sigma-B regulation protein RsbU (phosphoserine phosphatase)
MVYDARETTLECGDRLLIVTDGFTEAQDAEGRLYGDARVAAFAAVVAPSEQAALERLFDDVRRYEQGRPASDDVAGLLLTVGAQG